MRAGLGSAVSRALRAVLRLKLVWKSDVVLHPKPRNVADAVSTLLHARLEMPEQAIADLKWMVENNAVEGKVGACESWKPAVAKQPGAPCPACDPLSGSVLHHNT
jgi:hypothetical protein